MIPGYEPATWVTFKPETWVTVKLGRYALEKRVTDGTKTTICKPCKERAFYDYGAV